MLHHQQRILQQRLEQALMAFFALVTLSLVAIYGLDPSVYTQVLSLDSAGSAYPLPATLFLVVILVFIVTLIVGVRRHWRWVFWMILLAFSAGVLDILVTPLQLLGVFPNPFPVWYSWYRMGIACVQVVIAVWMWRLYAQHGVWAMGRHKNQQTLSSQT
jgi:hypothetical protein